MPNDWMGRVMLTDLQACALFLVGLWCCITGAVDAVDAWRARAWR